jgi:hypothetical protein
VHTISELKQGAVISDFDKLTANILEVGNELHKDSYGISRWAWLWVVAVVVGGIVVIVFWVSPASLTTS